MGESEKERERAKRDIERERERNTEKGRVKECETRERGGES